MVSLQLLLNVTLLVALSYVQSLLLRHWRRTGWRFQIVSGAVAGGVAIAGTLAPVTLAPGVFFDGRSVVLAVAGLFGGPLVAAVAAGTTALYRLILGGSGALVGVGVILASAALGVAYHYLRRRWPQSVKPYYLLAFGILVHVVMLALMLALPGWLSRGVLSQIALPVMTIYPLATLLMSLLFIQEEIDRAARLALTASEAQLRLLLDGAPDPIYVQTNERFAYVNVAALEMFGASSAEALLGQPILSRVAFESQDSVRERMLTMREEKRRAPRTERAFVRCDGSRFDAETSAVPIRFEGEIGALVFIRDITERKQAERALARERHLLRTLMENGPDMIYFKDHGGRFLRVNRAQAQRFGLQEPEQVIGKSDFDFFTIEHARNAQADEQEVMRTGQPIAKEEKETWPDGRETWVLTVKLPFLDENGQVTGTFGTSKEITERKRQEEERLDLERRLLQAQKLESLGVLAGGIAHDFNNLLTAMLGNLELALEDTPPEAPMRGLLTEASAAAQRAAELTGQMLAYAGASRVVVSQVDLSALVVEYTQLVRAGIAKTASLDLNLAEGLPLVEADRSQIQQVLLNLITNAAEAIGNEPGQITVSTAVATYDAATLARSRLRELPAPGRFVYLEVRDTGCGMNPATLARLGEPFFSTKFQGRGLGYPAVEGVVRGHGGALFVESVPGQGTVVRVLLPARRPTAQEDRPQLVQAHRASEWPGALGTVLVVDDEPGVRQVCQAMLGRLGYDVLTAEDGIEGIALLRQHARGIDAVILDLSMPHMDGAATFREMRRLAPELPVLLSSGYGEEAAVRGLAEMGLAGFVHKPYQLADLRAALEAALARGERG